MIITLHLTWRVAAVMIAASVSTYCVGTVILSYKDTRFVAGMLWGIDGLRKWDKKHGNR